MWEARNFPVSVIRKIGNVLTELAVIAVAVVVVGKVRTEHQCKTVAPF